jgi:hypothetical protein
LAAAVSGGAPSDGIAEESGKALERPALPSPAPPSWTGGGAAAPWSALTAAAGGAKLNPTPEEPS